jgi:uncharacterized protein (TIGR02996 family)
MSREQSLLEAIRENPHDDSLRLIYADWLEERGDPRSEFLRLECRIQRLPEAGADYQALRQRLSELGAGLDVRWRALVCRIHLETGPWHEHPRRCPLNVVGPFYTTGDCLACEAPEAEAPDLLAPLQDGNITTYFVRQPQTAEEIERACQAIEVCCVMDLRYGGTDPKIIARLRNDPLACDYLLAEDSPRLVPAPQSPVGGS